MGMDENAHPSLAADRITMDTSWLEYCPTEEQLGELFYYSNGARSSTLT